MYRPPSSSPKGAWARFLHERRRERGWSATKAFEELRAGLGLGEKSRASYLNLESGARQPKPHEAEFLISYFGRSPDDEPEPSLEEASADSTALIAALRNQTDALGAIPELVSAIRDLVTREPADVPTSSSARDRRHYWIQRATEDATPKVNARELARRLGQPTTFDEQTSRWLNGTTDVPEAWYERLAHALNLPARILRDPPATDRDRLISYRREAISELPAAEPEERERAQRRQRTA